MNPLLLIALAPNTGADRERLMHGLRLLTREDPTLSYYSSAAPGEVVIGALGELHLDIVLDRLQREFDVDARLGRPHVAYFETLTTPADGQMKHAQRS